MNKPEIHCAFSLDEWFSPEIKKKSVGFYVEELLGRIKAENIEDFHQSELKDIPSPYGLKDLEEVADMIIECILSDSSCVIFGDYDVDGVTSATLLKRFFDYVGYKNFEVFLPNRFRHGYGLTAKVLPSLLEKNPDYLFVIDSGTSSAEEVRRLREKGIRVAVIDHHQPEEPFVSYSPVVNPKRTDNDFPFSHLCGVAVLFFVLIGVRAEFRNRGFWTDELPEINLANELDLVALGTIADQMPLIGLNRILVLNGLKKLNYYRGADRGKYSYIQSVLKFLRKDEFDSELIAFRFSPLINSAGRMSDAHLAFQMISAHSEESAGESLQELVRLNSKRKRLQDKMYEDALQYAEQQKEEHGLFVFQPDFHEGIIGIVANKLLEDYHKPSVVLAKSEGPYWKGSCRSPGHVDMLKILGNCESYLEEFGGHFCAAGLKIHEDHLEKCVLEFHRVCKQIAPGKNTVPVIADIEVEPWMINHSLLEATRLFEPYGKGNPRPVFFLRDVETPAPALFGKNHLKWILPGNIEAVLWNGVQQNLPFSTRWSFCFHLGVNPYFRNRNLQLIIQKALPVFEAKRQNSA